MAAASRKSADTILAAMEPEAPELWFYNWRLWLETRRRVDRALAPLNLRSKEFWLLAIAGAGNVSQHEIAELFGVDPSTLVAMLDELERRGWLRRKRNPHDRRVQWVQRTETGDALFTSALPRVQQVQAEQLAVLSPTLRHRLMAAMRKLVTTPK
jgi:DNA-binding MarR family transcriptional regulator